MEGDVTDLLVNSWRKALWLIREALKSGTCRRDVQGCDGISRGRAVAFDAKNSELDFLPWERDH